jgi:hypothetical protein
MRIVVATVLMICLGAVLTVGCSTRLVQGEYACVKRGTCSLPEVAEADSALIYVIRGSRLFNQDEKQYLYVSEHPGQEELFLSYITDSRYCVIRSGSPSITVRAVGALNEDRVDLVLQQGNVYYLLLDTSASIFSTKLRISLGQVSRESGESYLMKDVAGPCG